MATKSTANTKASPKPKPENRGRGRWLVAEFAPVSLFSLRMTHATSKGGKTLVCPTPYSIKMALLDACFRRFGADEAETRAREWFDWLKWREIRILPPEHCVVQNTFVKILDHDRDGNAQFKNTIAYREFAYFRGVLKIAVAVGGAELAAETQLAELFGHVNYLGKKGGFLQFLDWQSFDGELPAGYSVPLSQDNEWEPAKYGLVQALDDFGDPLCLAKDGFDRVSTYCSGTLKLGEHRILQDTALPYRRRGANRHSTWYRRIDSVA
jgi:hypothetical protein